MVYRIVAMLPLLFFSGCGIRIGPSTSSYRPIDPDTGEPIVNAFTIGADWLMYFGILCIIGGLIAIVWKQKLLTGGSAIISGFLSFLFAQFLNFIGAHILLFSVAFIAFLALCCFLYVKAITTGLPWLEKLFKQDFNNDGHIGTVRKTRDDDIELAALENPENG